MGSDTLPLRRMLIRDCDSLTQREHWLSAAAGPSFNAAISPAPTRLAGTSGVPLQGLRWFAGVLRTADLLSDVILVTDTQLLDGLFFLGLGPAGVHRLLGRDALDEPPVAVLGRRHNLEESLRAIAVGTGNRFTGFEYSVLSPLGADPERLRCELDRVEVASVADAPPGEVATALAEALLKSLDKPDMAARRHLALLARRWNDWFAAEREGLVRFERFEADDDGMWQQVVQDWGAPSVIGRSPAWAALWDELSTTAVRSQARAVIRRSEAAGARDANLLLEWWDQLYTDLIARRHNADWLDIGSPAPARNSQKVRGVPPRRATLRGEAPQILATMPTARYSVLLYESRRVLDQWRRERSQAACDKIAYAVAIAGDDVDPARQRRKLLAWLSVPVIGAIIVFGLELVQVPRAALWLGPLLVLMVTVMSDAVVGLAPLWELRRARLRSVIHLAPPPGREA